MTGKIKYHVAAGSDIKVDRLFSKYGAIKCGKQENANLIVYLGGPDVSPNMYMQNKHITTFTNPELDKKEIEVYDTAITDGKAQVGICRGGQLLHCLAGGWLYQDVDKHNRSHEAFTLIGDINRKGIVTSDHHQAMGDINCGELLMFSPALSSFKEGSSSSDEALQDLTYEVDRKSIDIEAMAYPLHNSMSYQPHPEWSLDSKCGSYCKDMFFSFIEKCLEL